jgi:hypothetical protein
VREVGRRERREIAKRLLDEAGVSRAWRRTTYVIRLVLRVLAVVGVAVFVAGLLVSKGLVWIGLALFLGSVVLMGVVVAAQWRKIRKVRWQEGTATFRKVEPGYVDTEYHFQEVDCEVELSPQRRIVWVNTRVDRMDAKRLAERLVVGATMRCLIDRIYYPELSAFPYAEPNAPLPSGCELRFWKGKA